MKKIILVTTCFSIYLALTMPAFAQFSGGNGAQDTPFLISNIGDIQALADSVNNKLNYSDNKFFKLTADVLDSVRVVIGITQQNCFMGNFDGNSHKITLAIENTFGSNVTASGLFGYAADATIHDLTVDGYAKDNAYLGGIVGYGTGVTITNCKNYAVISANFQNFDYNSEFSSGVGGIIGKSISGTINNCINYSDITYIRGFDPIADTVGVAGIAGIGLTRISACINYGKVDAATNTMVYADAAGIAGIYCDDIMGCQNYGEITALCHVGGIAGWYSTYIGFDKRTLYVSNCENYGNIICIANDAGGILGVAGNSIFVDRVTVNVSNCRNSGDVSAVYAAGGITGSITDAMLSNCVNIAKISINNPSSTAVAGTTIGGIVGKIRNLGGNIANCVNAGLLESNSMYTSIGGIVGINESIDKHTLSSCINTGVILGKYDITSSILNIDKYANTTVSNCFYDKQLCSHGGIGAKDVTGSAEGRLTTELIGTKLQAMLGYSNWIYTDKDSYPILNSLQYDKIAQVAASPVFLNIGNLPTFDKRNDINKCFTVSTKNNVVWYNSLDKVTVNEQNVSLNNLGNDTLFAGIGTIKKIIPITVNGLDNDCSTSVDFTIRVSENKLISPNKKNYQIPIYITASTYISDLKIKKIVVSVNKNVFLPKAVDNGDISLGVYSSAGGAESDTIEITIENVVVPDLQPGIETVLFKLKGDAILGNTDSSEIPIKEIAFADTLGTEPTLINGCMTIEICNEEYDRFINLATIKPGVFVVKNPTSEVLTVKCYCIEKGNYALAIVDVLGNLNIVKEWKVNKKSPTTLPLSNEDGIFDFDVPITNLGNGNYLIIMDAPNMRYYDKFSVAK